MFLAEFGVDETLVEKHWCIQKYRMLKKAVKNLNELFMTILPLPSKQWSLAYLYFIFKDLGDKNVVRTLTTFSKSLNILSIIQITLLNVVNYFHIKKQS